MDIVKDMSKGIAANVNNEQGGTYVVQGKGDDQSNKEEFANSSPLTGKLWSQHVEDDSDEGSDLQ